VAAEGVVTAAVLAGSLATSRVGMVALWAVLASTMAKVVVPRAVLASTMAGVMGEAMEGSGAAWLSCSVMAIRGI
jgi:hypothetical protein